MQHIFELYTETLVKYVSWENYMFKVFEMEHTVIERMKSMSRIHVYLSHMGQDIQGLVSACWVCALGTKI